MRRTVVVVIINSRSILVGEGHDPLYSYLFMRNVRSPIDFSTLTPSARYTSTTLSPFHACSAGEQSRRKSKTAMIDFISRTRGSNTKLAAARITNLNRYCAEKSRFPRTWFVFLDVSSGPVEWREIKRVLHGRWNWKDEIANQSNFYSGYRRSGIIKAALYIGNIFDRILKILIVLFGFVLSWACAN